MIPRRPKPLCAICADREADTITDWECASGATRTIVACWPCLSPVPDPPEEYEPADLFDPVRVSERTATRDLSDAVLSAIGAAPESTFAEIAARLGIDDMARSGVAGALRKRLQRLEEVGEVTGRYIDANNVKRGRLFRLASSPYVAMVDRMPPEFTARDFRCETPRQAAGVIRALLRRDLIEQVSAQVVSGNHVTPAVWRRKESRRAS